MTFNPDDPLEHSQKMAQVCDSCAGAQGGGYIPNAIDSPAEFLARNENYKPYSAKLCRGCADTLRKFKGMVITPLSEPLDNPPPKG